MPVTCGPVSSSRGYFILEERRMAGHLAAARSSHALLIEIRQRCRLWFTRSESHHRLPAIAVSGSTVLVAVRRPATRCGSRFRPSTCTSINGVAVTATATCPDAGSEPANAAMAARLSWFCREGHDDMPHGGPVLADRMRCLPLVHRRMRAYAMQPESRFIGSESFNCMRARNFTVRIDFAF
jgi:hypothetical protein